jgi:hypothetical protein
MKTTTKKTKPPDPFAHAKDLPAAYRELREALAALVRLEEFGPGPIRTFHLNMVTGLSMCSLWLNADAKVAAWQHLGAAARRVEVAKSGRASARRTDGFKRERKAA